MKFKFITDQFSVLNGYTGNGGKDSWEDAETEGEETPHLTAIRIVSEFNRTLREGENPRQLLAVYVDEDDQKEQDEEDFSKMFVQASNLLWEYNEVDNSSYKIVYGEDGWGLTGDGEDRTIGGLEELIADLQRGIELKNI